MSLLNKIFKKTAEKEPVKAKKTPQAKKELIKPEEPAKAKPKTSEFKAGGILISPLSTEKAVSNQSLNKYIFKVACSANKIEIAKTIGKNYNVKVVAVNIINIPKKVRRVGKTLGFKSGYRKAIVTLAKGQSIEIK